MSNMKKGMTFQVMVIVVAFFIILIVSLAILYLGRDTLSKILLDMFNTGGGK